MPPRPAFFTHHRHHALPRLYAATLVAILGIVLFSCAPEDVLNPVVPRTKPDNADTVAVNVTWNSAAQQYRHQSDLRVAYDCPDSGSALGVWGTDTYTDDSSVCTAGVHAGKITFADGGWVVIQVQPGLLSYTGSTRNGVTSSNYAGWNGSFIFL